MYFHSGAELWTLRLSGQVCLVLNTCLFKVTGIYMFMNKIISYMFKLVYKLPDVLHQPVTMEGIRLVVRHNTNFITVHSRVTIGGCSMKFEHKIEHQFAHAIAHRMPYTSILSICMTLLQGHTKSFLKEISLCHSFQSY